MYCNTGHLAPPWTAADRLPANKNVKWGLGSNLWNSFKDRSSRTSSRNARYRVYRLRLTQFPRILESYGITRQMVAKFPSAAARGDDFRSTAGAGPARRKDPGQRQGGHDLPQEFGAERLWCSRRAATRARARTLSKPCASATTNWAKWPARWVSRGPAQPYGADGADEDELTGA